MTYLIGEAARRVGVSASALRLWERQGLVQPVRRGRYRLYSEADVEHLRSIRRLRQVDRLNAPGIRRVLRDTVVAGPHAKSRLDGRPLRRLRQRQGLSLRDAGRLSGLSVSFLSALERGVGGASVATLQRVTAAYGTTMLELFGPLDAGDRLVRVGDRPVLGLGDSIRIEQLARGAQQLEPQLFVLSDGATSDGAYAHAGEEFIYLLSGALTVWVGDDETYQLTRAGDALSFPSTMPHRWRNDARGETQLLWINTPPTF
ncbi:MAG: MerR family transcriptional regulator [Chloroflexi bacterium]|nr:MerR family transcriptional regulator [Chloroflexota bacterium]